MNVVSVIKQHPVPIIGAAVVLLILVSMRGSSSSTGGQANVGATLESQRIATAANVQIANINSQSQIARGAQGLAAFQTQLSENGKQAVARTSMLSDLFTTNITASTAMQVDTNKNLTTRLLAGINSQDNQKQMANTLAITQLQTDASVKTSLAKLSTDVAMNQTNNNAKLNAIGMTIEAEKYGMSLADQLARFQTSTSDSLTRYQTDVTAKNLPVIFQNAQAVATINGNTAQALASIATEADRTEAKTQASNAKAERNKGWIDTGIKLISAFF